MPLIPEYELANQTFDANEISKAMSKRIRSVFGILRIYGLWVVFAVMAALTAFQVHTMLIFISVLMLENPSLRPTGWTTGTIYGLSRVLWLVLGIFWLGWVMFSEGYLREGEELHILKPRALRLFIIIGTIYAVSYGVLLLLE